MSGICTLNDTERFNNILQMLMRCCVKLMKKILPMLASYLGYTCVDQFLSKEKAQVLKMTAASSQKNQDKLYPATGTSTNIEQWDMSLLNCVFTLIQRKLIINEIGNPIDPIIKQYKAQVLATTVGKNHEEKLYPPSGKPTDVKKWNMSLCSCICSLQKPQTLCVQIAESFNSLREMRNDLCHTEISGMEALVYDEHITVLRDFIFSGLTYIGDVAFEREIKEAMGDIEHGKMRCYMFADHTHLQEWYKNDRDTNQRLDKIEKVLQTLTRRSPMNQEEDLTLTFFFAKIKDEEKKLLYSSFEEVYTQLIEKEAPKIDGKMNPDLKDLITNCISETWKILNNRYEGMRVVCAKKECLKIKIRFDNTLRMWEFIKIYESGTLESLFEPIQTLLRTKEEFKNLEMTVVVPDVLAAFNQSEVPRFEDRFSVMSDEIPAKRRKLQGEPCPVEGSIETQYFSEYPENEKLMDDPSCSGQNTTHYSKKRIGKAGELKHKHIDVHLAENQENLENKTETLLQSLVSEGDRLGGTTRDVADEEKISIEEIANILLAENQQSIENKSKTLSEYFELEGERLTRALPDVADEEKISIQEKNNIHLVENQESFKNQFQTLSESLESEGNRWTKKIRDVADEEKISIKEIHQRALEGLKKTLVEYNLSKNSELTLGPFFQKENLELVRFYVPPTLSKVLPMGFATSYKKEPITSLQQLLNPLDRRKRFTCITSNAGLGKTSFCKFLARLWCAVKKNDNYLLWEFQGKADYLQDVEYLRKFDYLFSVSLKDVESHNVNIEDIIFSHLRNKIDDIWDVDENYKRTLQNDLNEKHTLIILDDITMSKITPPLESKKYTIICTCRPWKLGAMGMSTSTYTEIQLEKMNFKNARNLLKHANVCLNSQSAIKRDICAFFTVLIEHNLESLLPNPLLALQLLCIYHNRYDTNTTETNKFLLGKTRTHVYANVVDMMLKLAVEKEPECFEALCEIHQDIKDLPRGFDETETCKNIPSFVFNLGKLAFHDILRQSETEMTESFVCQYLHDKLKKNAKRFLLASGLISGSVSSRVSEKSMVYTFFHKTYQEMLACVYICTRPLNSDDWGRFELYFKANVSPDMMSFLCVMNYEQGRKCSEMYSSIERVFCREGNYHENELISYQNAVLMAHEECINSGTPKPDIVLKHMIVDRKNKKGPPCSLVAKNMQNINTLHLKSSERENDLDVEFRENKLTSLRTLIITGNNDTVMLETLTEPSSGHLRFLFINDVELKEKHVDLTGCTHLSYIGLENVCFSSLQIKAENLEHFWMYFENQFLQNRPPEELELQLKGKFSAKLKKLSVMHVKLNIATDLSECVNLQKLVLEHISSSMEYNSKCFQNFQHLTHLKELRLDSLRYPNDVTLDFSELINLERLRMVNVKVDKAVIAGEKLSELWVYYSKQIANTINPLIVTVPASSNFTNNLEQLSLVHVELSEHFNLSQSSKLKCLIVRNLSSKPEHSVLDCLANCNALEELRIEALNSHKDKVLDMSHMTNLKYLYIDVLTLNVQIVNIPTENLEIFWTYTSEPKQQICPPKELHLPEHAQFTASICELSLENVQVNETDLSMCENLTILRVDEISQSVVERVRSDALEELYLVNITTGRMGMVFKAKEWSRLSKLSFERCEEHIISPILNDASTLQTLQSVRFKNTRVDNIVGQFSQMYVQEMEFENMSLPDASLIDIANQFSTRSKALKCNVRNSIILSTNIEDVFAKLKNVCQNIKSPIIEDRVFETFSHQIDYLSFETNH